MNRDARNLPFSKPFRIRAPNLIHIHAGHGHAQLLRHRREKSHQILVRVPRPHLRRPQSQRVHIHHRCGPSHLFFRHLVRVVARSNFAPLFIRKANKDVRVLSRRELHRFIQRGQQGSATPVVHHPSPSATWSKCAPTMIVFSELPGSTHTTFGSFDPFTGCSERCSPSHPASANIFLSVASRCWFVPTYCLSRPSTFSRGTAR